MFQLIDCITAIWDCGTWDCQECRTVIFLQWFFHGFIRDPQTLGLFLPQFSQSGDAHPSLASHFFLSQLSGIQRLPSFPLEGLLPPPRYVSGSMCRITPGTPRCVSGSQNKPYVLCPSCLLGSMSFMHRSLLFCFSILTFFSAVLESEPP